jgi:hypothetical protein
MMPLLKRAALPALTLATLLLTLGITPASASAAAPRWEVRSVALPTNFSSADATRCHEGRACDAYIITITNIGNAPASELFFRDKLPHGVELVETFLGRFFNSASCREARTGVSCRYERPVEPSEAVELGLEVAVTPESGSSVVNLAEVEGGGAPLVVTTPPSTVTNTVNGSEPPFAMQDFGISAFGAGSSGFDLQAGDHPAGVTTTMNYTTSVGDLERFNAYEWVPIQEPKAQIVDLPLGFVGDALAASQCSEAVLREVDKNHNCPAGSQVGSITLEAGHEGVTDEPVYNLTPEAGYPAMFGFEYEETVILLRARVLPSAAGYVLSVTVPGIPRSRLFPVTGATVTFFGNPTEHDGGVGNEEALITNPDDCESGPLTARVEMDAWVNPGKWVSAETPVYEASASQGVVGCGLLQFGPALEVTPEETQADTPSGLEVDLRVPQTRNVPGLLATPDLKDAVVSLPEGVSVSPSAADGLAACGETGPQGINITHDWTPTGEQPLDPADPEAMEIGPDGLPHVAPGKCPQASQLGTVEVTTPLLSSPLKGHVFLAEPACGGEGQPACTQASATNGELYGLYVEAEGSGVIVKLKGTVAANPVTGQLTTTFRENPQLPFSELKLVLNGGERAALATPQTCGAFTTTSDLTPWSAPVTPDARPSSSFALSGCPATMPFAPTLSAHTLTAGAGGSSPFTLTLARHDGEQDLLALSATLPPGLVGLLSQVPLCGEAQAAAGSCPEASKIATTTVAVGAGGHPFWVSGSVYLTGPYNGAPFGLSVVVPANAGPFHLGNVIVRAAITVNPLTTAVTVTSGAFPQLVDGVPLRTQTVNVLVNRPGFMLNPTNCEQQHVTTEVAAAQGAVARVSTPFAVEGCKGLAFAPTLTASTKGKASKLGGASLDVRVTYPPGAAANIRSVKTVLPLQLPSRLETLQRACIAAVFESNPSRCPRESLVGIAKASTPVLPTTLAGPAYLVSHGNEKFPNLVIVLEGDGVRVDLVGQTDIKHGITSTTFDSVPDAPVSSFELYLPQGRYSILGTNVAEKLRYNLCGQKLLMPTEITGQNGAVIKKTTTIAITGCPKAKKAKKAKKAASKAKSARRARRVAS